MLKQETFPLIGLLALVLSSAVAQPAKPSAQTTKPPPVVQTFVATGASTDTDLARLRAALEKVVGVVTVEVRKGIRGATLSVKGDVLYTLLAAAARPLGYSVQPTPVRFFAATGPSGEADLTALRAAARQVPGVDRVALSPTASGAALRVHGIAETSDLISAAKTAGFALRQLGSYAASGSAASTDLQRLRSALDKVAGVEQIEMQAMIGGATLLVYGDVKNASLTGAAKTAGYDMWPLGIAANRSVEFRVTGAAEETQKKKLRELLESLEGIEEIQINTSAGGVRLVVSGERLKPDRIAAAAAEAGFELRMVDNITLPTLVPEAGRNTPADYGDAILEDPVTPGETAPQFTLMSKDGQSLISLSDYLDKRPVVLIFGSCT